MNVSLNLAQFYSNVALKTIPPDELVQRIGAQLGAVEDSKDWRAVYEGVVVVKVVSCERHPDADKLSLCLVDDGGVIENVERSDRGLVQVVCGAPNVHAGMYAAWIPPGVSVPSTRSELEPFVLEAREIRGKLSNGMLGSEKELDISDNHDGILEINPTEVGREPQVGDPLQAYFGLDDFVVDCENKMFTHRPDCFGNLGVARELAGIFGEKFESPEWYSASPQFEAVDRLTLAVTNSLTDLVPRFSVVVMDGVAVRQSPVWLRAALKRVGIKAVNNVVDVTNFIMHLTAQPVHAFDYDKLQKLSNNPSLQPRFAHKGEKLRLLNGKTIELNEQDIVIATDKTAVALAGIMGGAETEVDEETTRIVIECATFDMYALRRSSMRHGLFTDAVTRFNKGQSPLQNDRVLALALTLMNEHSGAKQASAVYDLTNFDPAADNLNHVETSVEFINQRLGSSLSAEEIKALLENVEFEVALQDSTLYITAPFWRMDITLAEDVVEEVGRLHGYDKLPSSLPKRTMKPVPKNSLREYKSTLRRQLTLLGGNEVLTYSFVHGELLQKMGIDADKVAYHVRNALSPMLQYYRPSLLPSLLSKVHANSKAGAGSSKNAFLLYEIGKAHIKGEMDSVEPSLPAEHQRLAGVYAADRKAYKDTNAAPYYVAKAYVDTLTNQQAIYLPLDSNQDPIAAPFAQGRSAVISLHGEIIGVVGEFRRDVRGALKLPEASAGFELEIERMQRLVEKPAYVPLSVFPSTEQDITLEVKHSITYGEVYSLLKAELSVVAAERGYQASIQPLSLFATDEGSMRYSFRLTITDLRRTLTTAEVTKVIEQLGEVAHDKMQAVRI